MNSRHPATNMRRRRSGLSLIEVVMSTLLVGMVLVGAMNLLGAVVRGRTKAADAARGQQLAQQLMTEILNMAYAENRDENRADSILNALFVVIGQEAPSEYDDVDDFHDWNQKPFFTRSGSLIPNTSGWRRRVDVIWVEPSDPAIQVLSDKGVKRITVTVTDERTVPHRSFQLISLRTDKYPPLSP